MYKNLYPKLLFIAAIAIISIALSFPLDEKINLGLDLQGGMHLVLRVDTSALSQEAGKDAPERALEVIRNRIDEFGVKEPQIQRQGENEIVVQLPGITDRDRALELIGKTALLEFKLVSNDPELIKRAINQDVPEGFELKALNEDKILVSEQAVLTGDALVDATVHFDESGFNQPYVALKFSSQGAREFADITTKNTGRRLAIVLDEKVQSAPVIDEPIPSGEAIIRGRFTYQEAHDLAIVLRVGALPAPIYIEEERTIGPLLGQDSINAGIKATLIGVSGVFLFMILYYLAAGLIACFALALNLLIIFGGLALLGSTLTLPGIAGIVLTLGMAVDANVLINERMKEELSVGRSLPAAIANGYRKAFSAIFDSNATTLIAAFLLFQFGTGPIRGFAVTLSLGLLASLFTSVFVTRTIFELLLKFKLFIKPARISLFKDSRINFIKYGLFALSVSIVIIAVTMGSFFLKGQAAFGVDFAGGQIQEFRFEQAPDVEDVRRSLSRIGLQDAILQQFESDPRYVVIRTKQDEISTISNELKESFANNNFELVRVEKVGPVAGNILRQKALKAIIFSILGILLYVGFRFKHFDYAFAGIAALFHDILFALGITVMVGYPVDLLVITALLTIAGYSINDTIVIFDRIRELTRSSKRISMLEIINIAVNQTLGRTVLTTFSTLIVVVSMLLFSGEVLRSFSFVLLVGFIAGTYSTIFIASPLVLFLSRRKKA